MTGGTNARRLALCRALIRIRVAIGQRLGFSLCPSPIWDMLLDLYLAEHDAREVYLWSLCIAANTPMSTAHRKVRDMERQGLVIRTYEGRDRRRIGIKMTAHGIDTVAALLDSISAICADGLTSQAAP